MKKNIYLCIIFLISTKAIASIECGEFSFKGTISQKNQKIYLVTNSESKSEQAFLVDGKFVALKSLENHTVSLRVKMKNVDHVLSIYEVANLKPYFKDPLKTEDEMKLLSKVECK